jgi:hypothetical protein
MFEWLTQTSQGDLVVLFGAIGAAAAAAIAGWRGVVKGKPTSHAALHTVAAANCSAPLLSLDLSSIKAELTTIHVKMDKMDDILVRLEDRTRR